VQGTGDAVKLAAAAEQSTKNMFLRQSTDNMMSIERTALLLDEREFKAEYDEIKRMVIAGEPGADYLRRASTQMFSVLQKTLDTFKREHSGSSMGFTAKVAAANAKANKYGGAEATPVYLPMSPQRPNSDANPIYEVPPWARSSSGSVTPFSLDKDQPKPREFYRIDAGSLLMPPVNAATVSIFTSDHVDVADDDDDDDDDDGDIVDTNDSDTAPVPLASGPSESFSESTLPPFQSPAAVLARTSVSPSAGTESAFEILLRQVCACTILVFCWLVVCLFVVTLLLADFRAANHGGWAGRGVGHCQREDCTPRKPVRGEFHGPIKLNVASCRRRRAGIAGLAGVCVLLLAVVRCVTASLFAGPAGHVSRNLTPCCEAVF
jgi:hypothetical protein